MLLRTSRSGVQNIFSHITKIPFAKNIVHKISESARGPCVVFFWLHRLLPENNKLKFHPHYQNHTALTPKLFKKNIIKIRELLNFISIRESLEILKGIKTTTRSHAVLLIDSPYEQTLKLIMPIAEELKIPFCLALSSNMLIINHASWVDEIIYRTCYTKKQNIIFDFIDRTFPLGTNFDRKNCAKYLIENLSYSKKNIFNNRMNKIRDNLSPPEFLPNKERMANKTQLQKIGLNSLVSFIYAGQNRLPLTNYTPNDMHEEIIMGKNKLNQYLGQELVPVFYYPPHFDSRSSQDIIYLLQENKFEAAIGQHHGVARPGDNMFCLPSLRLTQSAKSFEQFELQGLANAIDELLLVTLAQEKQF